MFEVPKSYDDVLDGARRQAFAEQALAMVNGGFLSLMVSVEHRTGLFDTLATLERAISDQIASAAGLNERYVREWLGATSAGCSRSIPNALSRVQFIPCTTRVIPRVAGTCRRPPSPKPWLALLTLE
jgi:Rv2258c-like winged HTH domain